MCVKCIYMSIYIHIYLYPNLNVIYPYSILINNTKEFKLTLYELITLHYYVIKNIFRGDLILTSLTSS